MSSQRLFLSLSVGLLGVVFAVARPSVDLDQVIKDETQTELLKVNADDAAQEAGVPDDMSEDVSDEGVQELNNHAADVHAVASDDSNEYDTADRDDEDLEESDGISDEDVEENDGISDEDEAVADVDDDYKEAEEDGFDDNDNDDEDDDEEEFANDAAASKALYGDLLVGDDTNRLLDELEDDENDKYGYARGGRGWESGRRQNGRIIHLWGHRGHWNKHG